MHTTESPLLRVTNDILLSGDSGKCAVLVLLDLSTAFDSVDHRTLLNRLKHEDGIRDAVLDWFHSQYIC